MAGAARWRAALRPHPLWLGVPYAAVTAVAADHAPLRSADTPSYLSLHFFGGGSRLWTAPLLFVSLPNDTARQVAQTAIAVGCWLVLGWQVQRSLRRPGLRWLALALVLVTGLVEQVTFWDYVILSESLSISLTVLLLAAWIAFARRARPLTAAAVVVVTTFWVFARQAQAFTAIVLILPPLVAWAIRRHPIQAVVAGLTAVIVAWGVVDSLRDSREIQAFNALDVISTRVLTNPAEEAFFTSHGMPVSAQAQRYAGHFPEHIRFYATDQPLVHWAMDKWTATYGRWLAQHPGEAIFAPLAHAPSLFAATTDLIGHGQRVLGPVQRVYDSAIVIVVGNLLVVMGAAFGWMRHRRLGPLAAVGLGAILACWVWSVIVWNSVANELVRLFAPIGTADRCAIIMLGVALLDAWRWAPAPWWRFAPSGRPDVPQPARSSPPASGPAPSAGR